MRTPEASTPPSDHPFRAVLLGTAVGDALGLPAEGLSPQRIRRRWKGIWRMRLVFGRGMVSDDTEHAVMTAQALLESKADPIFFQHHLSRRIRMWFACLPPGIGLATARSCIRLWLGVSPERSGVWSAGNGPLMRAPIIGAWFARDAEKRRDFIRRSTRITHTDPRAEIAAQAVAGTAAWLVRSEDSRDDLLEQLVSLSDDEEWMAHLFRLRESLRIQHTLAEFVEAMGLKKGVSGYAYHTAPVALYAVLGNHASFEEALGAVLDLGGDTDSVGAIVGALLALRDGEDTIPRRWLNGIVDHPISVKALEKLASEMAGDGDARSLRLSPWRMIPRNLILLGIVLIHGIRRLWP
ncbi:MAG: ADP-ribosylglycohydrolase family protein [Luteolibacter sp.]